MSRWISVVISLIALLSTAYFITVLSQLYSHEHKTAVQQVASVRQRLLPTYEKDKKLPSSELIKKFIDEEYKQDIALMIINNKGDIVESPSQKFIGLTIKSFDRISPKITRYISNSLSDSHKKAFIVAHDLDSNLMVIAALWRLNASSSLLMIQKKSSSAYFKFLKNKRHILFGLIASVGLLVLCICHFTFLHRLSNFSQYLVSILLFCLLCITLIIQLILFRTPADLPPIYTPLYSHNDVRHLLSKEKQSRDGKEILVPFGAYITHMNFTPDANITLSMWTWIKKVTLPEVGPIKLLLTQKISGDPVDIKSQGDNQLERYNTAQIKQNFSQTRYPFDDRYIFIEFWHNHLFNSKIILYPDLTSYNLSNPEDLLTPQLDPTIRIKDWNILESFYVSAPFQSNSELGKPPGTIQKLPNRIMLVILLRRDFTGPLMKFYLPLLVVLIMYFIGILLMSEDSIFRTLTYNASLLFVITLAASQARQYVATNNISFIEVMYIIVYSTIVLFSLFQLAQIYIRKAGYAFNVHASLKYIYWPSVCVAVLLNTFVYFW